MSFYRKQPDIIIRNGCIVDGTGKLPFYADIAVIGERIDYIGDLKGVTAPLDIDAHHKYVTNGFIDDHSHADKSIWSCPEAPNVLAQGVTTTIVGNCGHSKRTNVKPENFDKAGDGIDCVYNLQGLTEYPKGSMAATLDKVEKMGCGVNTAWLCGHNDIRMMVGCMGPVPTPEQMEAMKGWVRECMEAGYIGFSTGLEFIPGIVSKPAEVEELASVAAEYDANYCTHMRDEGTYLLEAVNEFLNVIRKTGLRGTISHLNVKYDNGVPNEYLQKGMQMLRDAREIEHLNVMCDMLSTTSAPGNAVAILPPWLYADGWDEARRILRDPVGREKVKKDLCRYWRFLSYGQWDRLMYVRVPWDASIGQKTFKELCAESKRTDPADVFLDILQEAKDFAEVTSCGMTGEVFFEQQLIDSVVTDPLYMWMADGGFRKTGSGGNVNPLSHMGIINFFTHYVRDVKAISIQDACKKVGSVPAQHFRLEDRGTLEVGKYADINVFDLNALRNNSDFVNPDQYASGMDYVFVNGKAAVAEGQLTFSRSGKVLRHLPVK